MTQTPHTFLLLQNLCHFHVSQAVQKKIDGEFIIISIQDFLNCQYKLETIMYTPLYSVKVLLPMDVDLLWLIDQIPG